MAADPHKTPSHLFHQGDDADDVDDLFANDCNELAVEDDDEESQHKFNPHARKSEN